MGLVNLGKVSLELGFLRLCLRCMLNDAKCHQMPAKAPTAAGVWRCQRILCVSNCELGQARVSLFVRELSDICGSDVLYVPILRTTMSMCLKGEGVV